MHFLCCMYAHIWPHLYGVTAMTNGPSFMCRNRDEITNEMEKESTNIGEFILLVLTSNIYPFSCHVPLIVVGRHLQQFPPLLKISVVASLCDGSTNYCRKYCDGFFKVDELLVLFKEMLTITLKTLINELEEVTFT